MPLVRVHTTMSLDGYIAGPGGDMDWVFEHGSDVPGELIQGVIDSTGAILTGRGSYDVGQRSQRPETRKPFGGRWSGPQFVLTHDPPVDEEDPAITFISGDIAAAVAMAREAGGERDVLVLGASVARQCLAAELVEEIWIYLMPVLLGAGVRLFADADEQRVMLEPIEIERWGRIASLRYRVAPAARGDSPPG